MACKHLPCKKVLRERQLPGHAIVVEIPDEEPSPVKNGEALLTPQTTT